MNRQGSGPGRGAPGRASGRCLARDAYQRRSLLPRTRRLPRRSRLPGLPRRRPAAARGHASQDRRVTRPERGMPPRRGFSAAAGPAGGARHRAASAAPWPRQDDADPAGRPSPAATGRRAGRDRRVRGRSRPSAAGGRPCLSRTNRGLRPVAALRPRVDRAQAGSPSPGAWRTPGGAAPPRDRPPAVRDDRAGRTRRHEQGPNAGYDADPDDAPSGQDRRQRPGPGQAGRPRQLGVRSRPGPAPVQSRVSGDTAAPARARPVRRR